MHQHGPRDWLCLVHVAMVEQSTNEMVCSVHDPCQAEKLAWTDTTVAHNAPIWGLGWATGSLKTGETG